MGNKHVPVIVIGEWLPFYKAWIRLYGIQSSAELAEAFMSGWNMAKCIARQEED